jgi:PAS domain-containing protein
VTRSEDRSLLLILARQLASNVATPMFVVDARGVLAFYNEAAEAILGQSFSATGPIGPEVWGGPMFSPEDMAGNPITVDALPLAQTLTERTPAHARFRITGVDGVKHTLEATSVPLFAKVGQLAGALAVFWEEDGGHPATAGGDR